MDASAGDSRPVIVFLGDSLTDGYHLDRRKAYPGLIQQRLDQEGLEYRVINAGISGDTTDEGLGRLGPLLEHPVAVFAVCLGINDVFRGYPLDIIQGHLREILHQVRQARPEAQLLVLGMRTWPELGIGRAERFQRIYPEIAREFDATLMPFLLEGVAGRDEYNLPDRLHPNAEGQRIIADNVWEYLRPMLDPAM